MEKFLTRLVIGVLIIWLVDTVLAKMNIRPDAKNIIEIIVLIVAVVFILFGFVIFSGR